MSSPYGLSDDLPVYVISVAAQLSGLHPQTLRPTSRSGWSPQPYQRAGAALLDARHARAARDTAPVPGGGDQPLGHQAHPRPGGRARAGPRLDRRAARSSPSCAWSWNPPARWPPGWPSCSALAATPAARRSCPVRAATRVDVLATGVDWAVAGEHDRTSDSRTTREKATMDDKLTRKSQEALSVAVRRPQRRQPPRGPPAPAGRAVSRRAAPRHRCCVPSGPTRRGRAAAEDQIARLPRARGSTAARRTRRGRCWR